MLPDADVAAVEARIRAFEARTGAEAVTAIVDRSDHYHGLRWRAFALGVALAALLVVALDLLRPDWMTAHAILVAVVTILGAGLACALLATLFPAFERLFLQRERAEAETRARARSLFLARELFATPKRNAVLLLVSRFERAAVVFGDTAYAGRVDAGEWQAIIDAMTPPFREGDVRRAFTVGLDALESLLVARGFRGDEGPGNVLPDHPLDTKADDE